jgi:hypothetical protein
MFPTTVVILLFIGITPCFMQTIPVDEDLQNELRAFQESLRTMDDDMEGQDIDQKEDFETRENTADIAQQDLDESLRTINEYMEEQNVDFETRENTADIAQQDLDENLRTIDENMKEQDGDENVDFETRGNTEDTDIESVLEEETRTLGELIYHFLILIIVYNPYFCV